MKIFLLIAYLTWSCECAETPWDSFNREPVTWGSHFTIPSLWMRTDEALMCSQFLDWKRITEWYLAPRREERALVGLKAQSPLPGDMEGIQVVYGKYGSCCTECVQLWDDVLRIDLFVLRGEPGVIPLRVRRSFLGEAPQYFDLSLGKKGTAGRKREEPVPLSVIKPSSMCNVGTQFCVTEDKVAVKRIVNACDGKEHRLFVEASFVYANLNNVTLRWGALDACGCEKEVGENNFRYSEMEHTIQLLQRLAL